MDKNCGPSCVVLVLLMLILFSFSKANVNGVSVDQDEEQSKKESIWVWHRLRSAYSVYSSLFPTSINQYWYMVKALVNHTYAYFFPPNIERGHGVEAVADKNGAGEKVKEALTKSLGTSKAALEDVARSAAEIAGENIDKVKKSLSNDKEIRKHPKEL